MKIIVRTTTITGIALLLAACGGSDDKSTRSGPPATPPPVATPTPEPRPPATPPPVATPTPEPRPPATPPPVATPTPEPRPPATPPPVATPTPEPRPPTSESLSEAEIRERLVRQPSFAKVGADEAWRTHGATGNGVRIAIADTPVDIRSVEFEGRIAERGSEYTYTFLRQQDYEDFLASGQDTATWGAGWEARPCSYFQPAGTTCREFRVDTAEEGEAAVRRAILADGYPGADEFWIVRIAGEGVDSIRYVPSPHLNDREHGTHVASTAAGKAFGVAPGAEIVVTPVTLGEDEKYDAGAHSAYRTVIEAILDQHPALSAVEVRRVDSLLAEATARSLANADIINRSFGPEVFGDFDQWLQRNRAATNWIRIRRHMPQFVRALTQADRDERDKTFVVTAAGNDSERYSPVTAPSVNASDAYWLSELRGLSFAVAALGRDHQSIATYSNRCGGLPGDWDTSRHGRHYCLTAPGSVHVRDVDGSVTTTQGTSFAAPMVSGALALMKERFRGQMTPREIGLRMVNTADNNGRYANAGIYGAGVLDVGQAITPQGTLTTGSGAATATLDSTYLYTPAAWGDVGRRLGAAEIAAFDDWDNAPFWSPLGSRIGTRSDPGRGVFPTFAAEAPEGTGATWGALAWRPAAEGGPLSPLHLAYSADPGGEIHAAGLAWTPGAFGGAMRAGLVFEQDRLLGGRGEGAFTSAGASHGLAFGTFVRTFGLGRRDGQDARPPLRLAITSTWAGGRLTGGSGMLVEASALYSQHRVALEHEREGNLSRISIEQPLRAESGSAAVHRPVGRDRLSGRWQYGTHKFGLRPEARALTLGLHHERDFAGGRIAIGAAHTLDAGHVAGREESSIGARYRLRF